MRVLLLTGQRSFDEQRVRSLKGRLGLGADVALELVTVHPLRPDLPVAGVHCVDPSFLPFRPLIPVSGPDLAEWGGLRKFVTRAARLSRSKLARAPRPARFRGDTLSYLASAAATSPDLKRLAANVDVIVALGPGACRAAWLLGRRVPGPLVVFGPDNVRPLLVANGHSVPPFDEDPLDAAAPVVRSAGVGKHNRGSSSLPTPPAPEAARLLIAPANYAGQAAAWAEAVRDHVPDATAINAQVGAHPRFPFPTDYEVDLASFNDSVAWRRSWRTYVEEHFTHVVVEANRPIFGRIAGDGRHHVNDLLRAGKQVALLSHGSDARIPSVHAAREKWHSYDALKPSALQALEERSRSNVAYYDAFEGPVFVSTPGLIEFIRDGVWLPLVINPDHWQSSQPVLAGTKPVVAHIPSSTQKGSHMIDPILRDLDDRGLITYLRVEGVPHEKMPELYGSADIVVEQFGIADYSTAACEAMAAGRVVVSRVADEARAHVREKTGLDLPIVEANPTTLERVILDLVSDPERARRVAAQGQEFCRAVHDGRRSAEVLGAWLHSDTPP